MKKQLPDEFDLSGKVAIVTGAGRGIGYHIALALAKYGADIVVCSRTISELEKVSIEIEKLGKQAMIQSLDITNIKSIPAMVDKTMMAFGHIDILVNNAGVNRPQWALDVTEENWDLVMNTNLKALFFCAQTVGRVMIKQKKGKIINISSDAGSVGLLRRAAYCASKGGVNLLTKVLALEWAQYNINVNAIAPAFIKTPLTEPMFEEKGFREYVLGNTPLGRVGEPKDVSGALVFLASEASNYMTGSVMLIDGGWTAH
ncbi:MAG: glucose 1-dehydrogenase [Desulfobacterales bacterium]|nr:MAG: glucose 1-dehydrogenase [Desulfobacterales bacterium]